MKRTQIQNLTFLHCNNYCEHQELPTKFSSSSKIMNKSKELNTKAYFQQWFLSLNIHLPLVYFDGLIPLNACSIILQFFFLSKVHFQKKVDNGYAISRDSPVRHILKMRFQLFYSSKSIASSRLLYSHGWYWEQQRKRKI